jgi:uncharacterized protein (TIGR03083 family)
MSTSSFAAWVAPAAENLRDSRERVVYVARAVPDDAWNKPSPLDGWTYHDLLGHLAIGDWAFQATLTSVIGGGEFDASLFATLDETNERYRRERVNRSVDELVAEVTSEGEKTQELLARLTDDHEALQLGRFTVGEWVTGFSRHDKIHTDELATTVRA